MAAPQVVSYASFDRREDWNECCALVLGYDWIPAQDANDTPQEQPIINLLDSTDDNHQEGMILDENDSHWTKSALSLQENIRKMARWIESKQLEYVSVEMQPDEASLIQSTVLSFAATTAQELESLRHTVTANETTQQHQVSIVQLLLDELKLTVVEPFSKVQKQRTREALKLWQDPLACRGMRPFFPQRDRAVRIQNSIGHVYQRQETLDITPPKSQFVTNKRPTSVSTDETNDQGDPKRPKLVPNRLPQTPQLPYSQNEEQAMHQEAVQLQMTMQHDLDSVQKMEQRMVDITTLLTQFSDLVSQQQDEIWQIHDSAVTSKENITKGHESLVDATERTRQSRHYTAKFIFALALMLLFFHHVKS